MAERLVNAEPRGRASRDARPSCVNQPCHVLRSLAPARASRSRARVPVLSVESEPVDDPASSRSLIWWVRERTRSTGSLCIRARSSLTSSESWTTCSERDTDDAEMTMSDVPEWETELFRSHSQHRKTAHKNGIKHVAKILNQVRNSYLLLRPVPRRTGLFCSGSYDLYG